MLEWIGWIATALFAVSYLCRSASMLRGIQAVAALAWVSYGLVIRAHPVVVANLVVAVMAGYSAWRDQKRRARSHQRDAENAEVT